jgi:hypothetical protein
MAARSTRFLQRSPPHVQPMRAEFEHLDHTLAARGLQASGRCFGPDALTWHYLPPRHETTSDLS